MIYRKILPVLLFPVIAMMFVVTLSNILVQFSINNWLTWGAFTFPIAFLVTDVSNRYLGPIRARKVVYFGFILAVILSLILADIRIAIASGIAFLTSQLLDIYIFNKLTRNVWWVPPLASSFISSFIDTVLFFMLAFAFLDLPWVSWAFGDYSVKVIASLILLVPYRVFIKTFVPIHKQV